MAAEDLRRMKTGTTVDSAVRNLLAGVVLLLVVRIFHDFVSFYFYVVSLASDYFS